MSMSRFMQSSGFKVLAMARLSQCEYSVIFYLMNCAVSGLDQIISTETELASLIGYEESEIRVAIDALAERQIIRCRFKDNADSAHPSMRLGIQFSFDRWHLSYEEDVDSQDAVVYPFLRSRKQHLGLLPTTEPEPVSSKGDGTQTWKRVVDSFLDRRSLDDAEVEENVKAAKILVETHPVDQVLLLLRHFQQRVPTLSLLASNWDHFQELFEDETQKIDLLEARKKHHELDQKLKDAVSVWLEDAKERELAPAEVNILKILLRHRHPRRQLFGPTKRAVVTKIWMLFLRRTILLCWQLLAVERLSRNRILASAWLISFAYITGS